MPSLRKFGAVLAAVALAWSGVPAAAQSVDAQIDALTARVERLEAARAVKKLQRAFGYYVDRGLWGEAADLFADDGTLEIGVLSGKVLWEYHLKAAGFAPEDIDLVMCTHLHFDHIGWNTKLENGKWVPTFRNARYVFGRRATLERAADDDVLCFPAHFRRTSAGHVARDGDAFRYEFLPG